ncbi:uncharacterized protein LOC113799151 [Dermatophagoides pteronyssinus]|uniref:uncharacterized protein LOC113799151 n=1 Tax=Dermatophagoides pteronyssinus TaxID=6956 RepID=UPI003F660E80
MDSDNNLIIPENILPSTAIDNNVASSNVIMTDTNLTSLTIPTTTLPSISNIPTSSVTLASVDVPTSSTITGIEESGSQHIIPMITELTEKSPSTIVTDVIDNQLLQQQSTSAAMINNIPQTSTAIFAAAASSSSSPAAAATTTPAVPVSINVPIKLSGSTQPIFVSNQGIITTPTGQSNVPTLANTFVSYILPTHQKSSLPKSGNNQSTATLVTPNISETAIPATALINTPIVINASTSDTTSLQAQKLATATTNPTNVKLIQTSNQRHLVFSPIKPTNIGNVGGNTQLMTKSIVGTAAAVASPVKSINPQIIDNNKGNDSQPQQQFATPATILAAAPSSAINQAQQQQQQLIILSPVKPAENSSTKSAQFIPSFKILPPSSSTLSSNISNVTTISGGITSVTTSQSLSKRSLTPAPITKTIVSTISPANVRPIQATTTNKNVQYISFVPINSTQQIQTSTGTIVGTTTTTAGQIGTTKFVPIKQSKQKSSSSSSIKSTNLVQVGHGQKVLVNPNTIKISGTATTIQASITMPSSTITTTSTSNNNKSKNHTTSVWMLPKQIIKMNDSQQEIITTTTKYVPIAPNPNQPLADRSKIAQNLKNALDGLEESKRKPCNCTRSQCLKLYCDCFANGEFCNGCNCVSCCNNLENEEIRQKAIRLCLDRNPNAFHPKIGQSNQGDIERRHTKGCCCKRSGCLKNYCECYEAKILCSDKCKCIGCKNFEESDERKTLMHLADVAMVRLTTQPQTVASKMHVWGPEFKSKLPVKVKSDCHPFNVLTNDILEATASCLLAQAEEGEFENLKEENIESLIMDQFGECLSQILNLANNGMADDDGNSDDDVTMNDDVDCPN